MSRTTNRHLAIVAAVAMLVSACTGSSELAGDGPGGDANPAGGDESSLVSEGTDSAKVAPSSRG